MSYYTEKTPKCGSCVYTVEELDLTGVGFPGLTFNGEVSIEPDDTLDNEDWYIAEAYAANADGRTYTTFRHNSLSPFHRALFEAVRDAILADNNLRDHITDFSRDHA